MSADGPDLSKVLVEAIRDVCRDAVWDLPPTASRSQVAEECVERLAEEGHEEADREVWMLSEVYGYREVLNAVGEYVTQS